MTAQPSGSFMTVLLTGSLAAMGLMAVFGVPQMDLVTASIAPAQSAADDVLRQHSSVVITDHESSMDLDACRDFPGADFAMDASAAQPAPFRRSPRPLSGRALSSGPADSRMPEKRNQSSVSRGTFSPASLVGRSAEDPTAASITASANSLPAEVDGDSFIGSPSASDTDPSWHTAAQRLQALGIDDYRLERGIRSDSFLFICQFVPGGDCRVVQRFEAEADRPIDAVHQVLAQIEQWRQRTQTSRPVMLR